MLTNIVGIRILIIVVASLVSVVVTVLIMLILHNMPIDAKKEIKELLSPITVVGKVLLYKQVKI